VMQKRSGPVRSEGERRPPKRVDHFQGAVRPEVESKLKGGTTFGEKYALNALKCERIELVEPLTVGLAGCSLLKLGDESPRGGVCPEFRPSG